MKTIYCLELIEGRFYVGQTPKGRMDKRYDEHIRWKGAKWTTRYPPVRILWSYDVEDKDANETEERECCSIMMNHGPNSCRGGTFNIGYPVPMRGPRWLKGIYLENWCEIAGH